MTAPGSIQRCFSWFGAAASLLCLPLAACSFDEARDDDAPNACTVDAECSAGLSCQVGFCVTSSDAALSYVLDVTPKRMPNGSQPFPIQVGPFLLRDGRSSIELPVPVTVSGMISDAGLRVPAQLTFVPTKLPAALARATTARAIDPKAEYSVQLLADVEYRVTIQPTDSSIPPHTLTLVASDQELNVDYAQITRVKRKFMIANAPGEQSLSVKARAKDGGQVISNTARLTGGRVELEFTQEVAYRLEISPEQSFIRARLSFDVCDDPANLVPSFNIDDSAFEPENGSAETLMFTLPDLPEPVQYAGIVELCSGRAGAESLMMTLSSDAVAFSRLPPGMTASFSTTTVALPYKGKLGFCTRTLPGDYVVLVPPPSGANCEIFSEKRRIEPATEEEAADPLQPLEDLVNSNVLSLRTPAKLSGTVQDESMKPVANATIEAVALGVQHGVVLAEDDPTVPVNNRSRQTLSDATGSFTLSVDVGAYDLVIKPPSQSGFAWKIQPGLNVAARVRFFATKVELSPPALVEAGLRYSSGRNTDSLAGAEVHAYTVIDPGTPQARALEIGRTTADPEGGVMLLVSAESQGDRPW